MSTGETHPRAKRPMNRAKTSLRRRAAPNGELKVMSDEHKGSVVANSFELVPESRENGPVHVEFWFVNDE